MLDEILEVRVTRDQNFIFYLKKQCKGVNSRAKIKVLKQRSQWISKNRQSKFKQNSSGITLRELIFAGTNFRETIFEHFAGTNFCE